MSEDGANPYTAERQRVSRYGEDGYEVLLADQPADGILRITSLQMPGKRPVTAQEFLNARDLDGALFR